jgi:hypothetical protein
VIQVWHCKNLPSAGFFSDAVQIVASLLLPDSEVATSSAHTKAAAPEAGDAKNIHWDDKVRVYDSRTYIRVRSYIHTLFPLTHIVHSYTIYRMIH